MSFKTATTFFICYVLLVLLGPIAFQFGGAIPVTLQSLVAFVPVLLFGLNFGLTLAILYLISGMVGLPVFAGYTSGFGGPSTGFLIGFLVAVIYLGLVKPKVFLSQFLHLFMAHILVVTIGIMVMYAGFNLLVAWPTLITLGAAAAVKSLLAALTVLVFIKLFPTYTKG